MKSVLIIITAVWMFGLVSALQLGHSKFPNFISPRTAHSSSSSKLFCNNNLKKCAAILTTLTLISTSVPLDASAYTQTFLKEPTNAFNEEAARTKDQKSISIKKRAQWDKLFTTFEDSKDSDSLESSLKAMIGFLKESDDIPTGFTKKELVKRCRARKNMDLGKRKPVPRPEWTTKVEVQYQALIQQYNKNLNPANAQNAAQF